MAEYVEEFLYRGRPPHLIENGAVPSWHVRLGREVMNPYTRKVEVFVSEPMTATEAEAAGWPPARISADIDSRLMIANESLRQRLAELQAALLEKDEKILELRSELAELDNLA